MRLKFLQLYISIVFEDPYSVVDPRGRIVIGMFRGPDRLPFTC
jgi:hypothetical protein